MIDQLNKSDQSKQCKKCNTWKPLDLFPNYKMSKDGKSSCCKSCFKIYNHNNYLKNKEKFIADAIEWQKNNPKKAKAARNRWLKNKHNQNPVVETTAAAVIV